MDYPIILGFVMMALCVSIQCLVVAILLRVLLGAEKRRTLRPNLIRTTVTLIAVMLILLTGNLGQIALWAALFLARGEFHDFSTAFYHSVVNFSTLGYGDIIMGEKSRLLGALEAANGVLMFGLTTSVVFAVLNEQMQEAWNKRVKGG